MTFLLDTNVVSELRKVHGGRADPGVAKWVGEVDADNLFISAITIFELELGVLLSERKDPAQGAILRAWLDRLVIPEFRDRTLPIDAAVARRCAGLSVFDPRAYRDAFIAATAICHVMTLVTRNMADFQKTGVKLFNPWNV